MLETLTTARPEKTAVRMEIERALKAKKARTSLRDFIEYCMPDPDNYEDPTATMYECRPVHNKMINLFTRTVQRETLRSALSVPSQHGKTTITAEYGLAWVAGNFPSWPIIYGTYSDPRAKIVGEKVRLIMESQRFKEVFPDFEMRKGSKAKDFIGFTDGGSIMFLGRNSGGAGNPCALFVIDDPYKNMGEAKSPAIRAEVWSWYTSVVEQRCPASTPIFIIHTRWSDDDLIGRLCDPDHPDFDAEDNDEFEYLKLPGIIYEGQVDALGVDMVADLGIDLCSDDEAHKMKMNKRCGSLWPQKRVKQKDGSWKIADHWPVWLFLNMRRKNSATWSAMVMSDPVPPAGDFFNLTMIKPYRTSQLPQNLLKYGASDHAVSTAKRADSSVIGCFGVCDKGEIWVFSDLIWGKYDPVDQVEKMTVLIQRHRPRTWWAEADHIKKAIMPFLKKILRTKKLFSTYFDELTKTGDKQQKAQSIRAMAAMGMLHLPQDAAWFDAAKSQMLRFDGSEGRPDDFVDFLANIGRGLDKMHSAPRAKTNAEEKMETGSPAWIKFASKQKQKFETRAKALAGW